MLWICSSGLAAEDGSAAGADDDNDEGELDGADLPGWCAAAITTYALYI
jgi:hypothetical protein